MMGKLKVIKKNDNIGVRNVTNVSRKNKIK
jgi:hypothetical protein